MRTKSSSCDPSYAMYGFTRRWRARMSGELDYRADTCAFPLEELLETIQPTTRAVLIANPNNPTGTAVKIEGIERILKRAANAAVLIDEAYYEFCGITALRHIGEYPNLFVSRTFSKVYGMAGMRLGCLFSQAAISSICTRPVAIQREHARRLGRARRRAG